MLTPLLRARGGVTVFSCLSVSTPVLVACLPSHVVKRSQSSRHFSVLTRASGPSDMAQHMPACPQGNQLLWLRQDLRLHDHPALSAAAAAAAESNAHLRIVFVISAEEDGTGLLEGTSWRPMGASLVWLHASLQSLDKDLRSRYGPGAGIIFRRGPYLEALKDVASQAEAKCIHFSRRYEPAMQATDERVVSGLEAAGVAAVGHQGHLLYEPQGVRVDMGRWKGHYGTLMPFLMSLPVPSASDEHACGGLSLEDLDIVKLPKRPDGSVVDWASPILEAWDCSEGAALKLLETFVTEGLKHYESRRGYADARSVSRVSPYLRWGQLSPRHMLQRVAQAGGKNLSKTFWRRLTWRDLAYWQLLHFPDMSTQPIRSHYADQQWREDPEALKAWQLGQTGFPLVDAGMRQLWQTGWMQQNVRMVVACFLTEYMNMHWVHGCRWFHDTLDDADLAINSMMWQNAGKAGLDGWNFTVSPISGSQDPGGEYVATWVPELKSLPKKYLHKPWEAPPEALEAAGVQLGKTYPHRIETQRLEVLRHQNADAIRAARKAHPESSDNGGYDTIMVPEGSTVHHDNKRMRVFTKHEYRDPDAEHPIQPIGGGSRGRGRGGRGRGRGGGRARGRGQSRGPGRGS